MIFYLDYKFVRYVGEGGGCCKKANRRLQQISNLRLFPFQLVSKDFSLVVLAVGHFSFYMAGF